MAPHFLHTVIAAMQGAKASSSTDGKDYIELMQAIAKEAAQRIENFKAWQRTQPEKETVEQPAKGLSQSTLLDLDTQLRANRNSGIGAEETAALQDDSEDTLAMLTDWQDRLGISVNQAITELFGAELASTYAASSPIRDWERLLLRNGMGAGDALALYELPETTQEAFAAGWNRRDFLECALADEADALGKQPSIEDLKPY